MVLADFDGEFGAGWVHVVATQNDRNSFDSIEFRLNPDP